MKYKIRLDICTLCNLNCPACSMRKMKNPPNGRGYLSFDNFKKFIDRDGELIDYIEISNFGEPLLNPDFLQIVQYAHKNNIKLDLSNGTNLNIKNDEYLRALVDCGFESVTVSCDGVSQECYEKYRRNGNVELVFENIKKLIEYRAFKKADKPRIIWQYILRESSEDEVELAIKKAKELKVDSLFFKLTFESSYIPKDPDKLKQLTGLKSVDRREFNKNNKNYAIRCEQLFEWPQINWNGDLLGCCKNKHSFGVNVFEVGLLNALQAEKFLEARRWLKDTSVTLSENNPCRLCKTFNDINNDRQTISTPKEVWNDALNKMKE